MMTMIKPATSATWPREEPARKWPCPQCPKQFVRQDHLQRHQRAHTQARPFICSHCSKAFSRRDVLLRHTAQVHELVPSRNPFETFTARNPESPTDDPSSGTPVSGSPLSVSSDLDELLTICSDPMVWTSRERSDENSRRNLVSRNLAITTRPLRPQGEYTEDWRAPSAQAAHLLPFPTRTNIAGGFLRPEVPGSLTAHGGLGVPTADLAFLMGLNSLEGQTATVMNIDRKGSMGGNLHIGQCSTTHSPLVDLAHGLGKSLDTPNIEALFAIYTGHFIPNLPFVHLQTLDLDSALKDKFPKVNQGPSFSTSSNGRRPLYKPLFLAMLAHGAAYTSQPALARRLHLEVAKAIRSDLSALSQMGVTKAPLYIIQAMIHQIHLGLSFGDLPLEESTLGHIYSLMALVKDAMLFKPPDHRGARLSSQNVQTQHEWLDWVEVEEHKRTFFAVIVILSAALTMFNSASHMDIQSISITLPCQEFLWEAETIRAFQTRNSLDPKSPPLFQDEYGSLFKVDEDLVSCDCDAYLHTGLIANPCVETSCDCVRKENLSGFGYLILISALCHTIARWNQCQKTGSNRDIHTRDIFRRALSGWRARWKSLEEVSFHSPEYRLLISCLPMLDHAELLLKVDITSAKEALHHRRYSDVGVYVDMSELQSSHNNSISPRYPDNDFLNAYNLGPCYSSTDDKLLYDAALYSARAIQLSMQKGPWWNCKKASVDIPLHTAVIAFHCTQILCTWLVFLHTKTQTQNSSFDVPDSEAENDEALLRLCRKIAQQSLRRLDDYSQIQQTPIDSAISLALTLAQVLANFFQKQLAWPVLNHLATSLKVRITNISDKAQASRYT